MRNRLAITFTVLFAMASAAVAATDPGQALALGKTQIAAKKYKEAAAVLSAGLENLAAVPEAHREQARAALSFYAAVAYSGARDDAQARRYLADYLRLSPDSRRIDAAKYDPKFVALFGEMTKVSGVEGDTGFDSLYPGFVNVSSSVRGAEKGTWGQSVGLIVLASKAERRTWEDIIDSGARERFIEEFWRKRDRSPETAQNEFRNEFERRVAFADQQWSNRSTRGAFSDRGKVFILLGPPSFVKRRPIQNDDRVQIVAEAIDIVNGTMEHWVYAKDQLPMATSRPTLLFRFVTQSGIGEGIMQLEDPLGKQALTVAAAPLND